MMKQRLLVVLALAMTITAAFSTAFAQTPKGAGSEVIKLKMGDMELPFQHWKHQQQLKGECFHCHGGLNGKIEGWGKETAHKICIACHELEEKGPVTCRQCHSKAAK
jgi:hypothetical protein